MSSLRGCPMSRGSRPKLASRSGISNPNQSPKPKASSPGVCSRRFSRSELRASRAPKRPGSHFRANSRRQGHKPQGISGNSTVRQSLVEPGHGFLLGRSPSPSMSQPITTCGSPGICPSAMVHNITHACKVLQGQSCKLAYTHALLHSTWPTHTEWHG